MAKRVSAQNPAECGLPGCGWVPALLGTFTSVSLAQCISGDSSSATLHCVVDEVVRFRLKVRQYALATPGATGEVRRQQLQERQPLLEACDALRQDLATHGINVKVSNTQIQGTPVPQETVLGKTVAGHPVSKRQMWRDMRGRVCMLEELQTSALWARSWPSQAVWRPSASSDLSQ